MISASKALDRLREGNKRFVAAAQQNGSADNGEVRSVELPDAQSPFAIVLGCADSRVPPEIVFDQGLGDLFVVRVAGNTVDPTQLGSIEFAAHSFGTRLIVVLGHSGCGAVKATLNHFVNGTPAPSAGLKAVIDSVAPAVQQTIESAAEGHDADQLMAGAVRANVAIAAQRLRDSSEILAPLITDDGLVVVGAEYSLKDGSVEFFDGVS